MQPTKSWKLKSVELWERACSRRRWVSRQIHWLRHRIREQARSHTGSSEPLKRCAKKTPRTSRGVFHSALPIKLDQPTATSSRPCRLPTPHPSRSVGHGYGRTRPSLC
ncbi:hypothetical protein FPT15_20075 [Pseudomonas sp. RGB]|nr:hypothetical protein FPT15_20075 [Pseudomonas sp. RGB]